MPERSLGSFESLEMHTHRGRLDQFRVFLVAVLGWFISLITDSVRGDEILTTRGECLSGSVESIDRKELSYSLAVDGSPKRIPFEQLQELPWASNEKWATYKHAIFEWSTQVWPRPRSL